MYIINQIKNKVQIFLLPALQITQIKGKVRLGSSGYKLLSLEYVTTVPLRSK